MGKTSSNVRAWASAPTPEPCGCTSSCDFGHDDDLPEVKLPKRPVRAAFAVRMPRPAQRTLPIVVLDATAAIARQEAQFADVRE